MLYVLSILAGLLLWEMVAAEFSRVEDQAGVPGN